MKLEMALDSNLFLGKIKLQTISDLLLARL
jgi:hypothetical protein